MMDVNRWPLWIKIFIGIVVWIGILWTPKSWKGALAWLGILLFVAVIYLLGLHR